MLRVTNHSLKNYREGSDNVMVINYNKLYFLKFGLTNLDIYMNGNTKKHCVAEEGGRGAN